MIVLLNGALGVGKSTAAEGLAGQLEACANLEADALAAADHLKPGSPERSEVVRAGLLELVPIHLRHGARNLVISSVWETPSELAALRAPLWERHSPVHVFRLECAAEEAERRIRRRAARGTDPARLAFELGRNRELVELLQRGAEVGDLGRPIDTTKRTPAEVVDRIHAEVTAAVELVTHDPAWREAFERERQELRSVLDERALAIEHIGSTAVGELIAKPIVDIAIGVRDLDTAQEWIPALARLGYHFLDYPENTTRRFFKKGAAGATHHVHVLEADGAEYRDHLRFRDALRADPARRDAYAALKHELAAAHSRDRIAYSDAKSEFVAEVLAESGEGTSAEVG
ncbi:MAG: GrpB family protein [Proteobacteria bacterium]|nr:GrpB family protein [Pseudomonadota bacterium]